MDKNEKQIQNDIASHIGRLLRESFGKGPQSIYVNINRPFIVIYLRNFLAPTEKILLQQDQVDSVRHTRDLVMKSLMPEIKAYLLQSEMNIREFYYDWGFDNYSGILVGMESDQHSLLYSPQEWYAGKEKLHVEIERISQQIQKKPEEIRSYLINERTLLVVRTGILNSLGKELLRLGLEENLKLAERNLERSHLINNNHHFQKIFQSQISDMFIDWDFHRDKSVIVFILNPSK